MRRLLAAAIACAGIAAAAPCLTAVAVAEAEPPPGAAACTGCHPASARVNSPVPRLAGLDAAAIVRALQEFRAGTRPATVMDRLARGFTEDEVRAIAAWYAARR